MSAMWRGCAALLRPAAEQAFCGGSGNGAAAAAALDLLLLQRRAQSPLLAHSASSALAEDPRSASGAGCSTSGRDGSACGGWQQWRGYAKKGGGGGGKAAAKKAPAGGAKTADAGEDISRPTFSVARPRRRRDPFDELPATQRAFLEELAAPGADGADSGAAAARKAPRGARQLGWDLGAQQTLALLHHSLSSAAGGAPVYVTPFVVTDLLQSAQALAEWVKLLIEAGEDFSAVERFFTQTLATRPRPDVRGVRVQVKGRLAGKAGMAEKRAWQHGAASVQTIDDPVDSAKAVAETTAGLIGVKATIVYRRDVVGQGGFYQTRLKAPHTLQEVLALPRAARVKASTSAWWAAPGPLQPGYVGAARAYKDGFDAAEAFSATRLAAGGGGGGGGQAGGRGAAISALGGRSGGNEETSSSSDSD